MIPHAFHRNTRIPDTHTNKMRYAYETKFRLAKDVQRLSHSSPPSRGQASCRGLQGHAKYVDLYKILVCWFRESALINAIVGTRRFLHCPPLYFAIDIGQPMDSPQAPCFAILHTILVLVLPISCKGHATHANSATGLGKLLGFSSLEPPAHTF